MKRPILEKGSRRLFKEYAGQRPSVLLWLSINQEMPCFRWTFSQDMPACSRATTISPVTYPSLLPSSGVASVRSHILAIEDSLQPLHVQASEDSLQPPSSCCLLRTSLMMDCCCSRLMNPGNFTEAHRTTTRLIVDCAAYSRSRYSRSNWRLFWIFGIER